MSKDPSTRLTPKQEKFCQEYMVDLNATQAAVRAGYSTESAYSTAWENLRKPEVQARIQALQKETEELTLVTREYVMGRLRQLVDECWTAEHWSPSTCLKGLELMGRHIGMFATPDAVAAEITKLARLSGASPTNAQEALAWMIEKHRSQTRDLREAFLADLTDEELRVYKKIADRYYGTS